MKSAGFATGGEAPAIRMLAQGGSDRMFYRVTVSGRCFVVLTASAPRSDIRPFVDVGTFLMQCGIGVPQIFAWDDARQLVLMEDLGDDSLYGLLQQAKMRQEVMGCYRQVLSALAELQMRATPRMETCAFLRHRSFGYEALRWETDYFMECFVRQYCGIADAPDEAVEHELHLLAAALEQEPRYFMHRDFQSKNIYFKQGTVRIIDFQTATRGLLQYDLASLLKDAYFILDSAERDELLDFYLDELAENRGGTPDREHFFATFHRAGLQRNMQALGAFAFLSMHKGKHEFINYIPAGMAFLRETLTGFPEYPALAATVEQAARALEKRGCTPLPESRTPADAHHSSS